MNKKKYSIFPSYNADMNQKGKVYYISFKYLCFCLYIIGFCCVILCKSLENQSFGIVKIRNRHERNLGEVEKYNNWPQKKNNLKYKKEDVNKTNSNINMRKCNERRVEKYKNIISNNLWNVTMENESCNYINNINYNDMSRNLTEKELRDVLDSLEKCPSKDDLINIWSHTRGIAKEGFDNVLNVLKASIQKYLDNDIHDHYDKNKGKFIYDRIWNQNLTSFCETVANEEAKYNNDFFRLINSEHTLDDILKFTYSFLEYFEILKKKLQIEYQEELFRRIRQSLYLLKFNNYEV
ncbi:Plasmodium exported protein (PHIST), unknown, putative [Plasmodium sp. gorilla clade G1]|nr:Plasmodium exported protein (PHIST), unknown, putative [Plasmodium sp. gorilla clade G1]